MDDHVEVAFGPISETHLVPIGLGYAVGKLQCSAPDLARECVRDADDVVTAASGRTRYSVPVQATGRQATEHANHFPSHAPWEQLRCNDVVDTINGVTT